MNHSIKKILTLSLPTIFALSIFSGCAQSSYSTFYTPNQTVNIPNSETTSDFAFLPDNEEPEIISTSNLESYSKIMLSKHFIPIGSSSFGGTLKDPEGVVKQAKKIKALAALHSVEYSSTAEILTTERIPYSSVYFGGGMGGGMGFGFINSYDRTSTSLVRLYDQKAIFYIKDLRPNYLGLQATEIPREKRIALTQNGFSVDVIFENSIAYHSDIMLDDIITVIDGTPLDSQEIFNKTVKSLEANKTIHTITVLRKNIEHTIIIKN